MTRIELNEGWKLFILEGNENSYLENHSTMELGADDENNRILAFDIMCITYGLDSVLKAANIYATKQAK